jgi:electron transfer flavoprotein alpha/beta subunit
LLKSGRLAVSKPLTKRVTFHDPCHLGRLNGGYEAPREVLRLIGCELVEMPRNRDNSFCCGAGGGRIWIPDTPGTEKPSENRMHEAARLAGIDVFVTCCPKDLVMFEDARKTGGHEKDFVVQDLAELVAEAIELKSLDLKDLPTLADRIVKAVAHEVSEAVAARLDAIVAAHVSSQLVSGSRSAASVGPVPSVERSEAPIVALAPAAEITPTEQEAPGLPPARSLTPATWEDLRPVQPADFSDYVAPPEEGPRILVTTTHVAKLGDEYEFTSDGRDVRKEFMEFSLNEWDDAALEEALQCVERLGKGEVVAVTVGDADADASLLKALAKGAHRAVRVWDPALSNADPITIARALAGIARREEPDLILCGVQSGDHAHGATGTALARILGLPHAAVVVGVAWDGTSKLILTRELEGGLRHSFELKSPSVVAIQTGINTPRFATMKMIKQAKQKPLVVVEGAGVVDGSGGYLVRRMYVPEQTRAEMLEGSPQEVAKMIADLVREKKGG